MILDFKVALKQLKAKCLGCGQMVLRPIDEIDANGNMKEVCWDCKQGVKERINNGYLERLVVVRGEGCKWKRVSWIIMEKEIGRPIGADEWVDYKDGNKRNLDIGNLVLRPALGERRVMADGSVQVRIEDKDNGGKWQKLERWLAEKMLGRELRYGERVIGSGNKLKYKIIIYCENGRCGKCGHEGEVEYISDLKGWRCDNCY